jgi:hypothetical protein
MKEYICCSIKIYVCNGVRRQLTVRPSGGLKLDNPGASAD